MLPELTAATLLAGSSIAAPAAVYLWSTDPQRRRRAWQLLKLLIGR